MAPWTYQRVTAQRWIPIEEDQDVPILVNHDIRAAVFRVTLCEQADKARPLSHSAFVGVGIERHSLGHRWYNAPGRTTLRALLVASAGQMFTWYIEDGLTLYGIAQRLIDRGILTPSGRLYWNPSSVQKILMNAAHREMAYGNQKQITECPTLPALSAHPPHSPQINSLPGEVLAQRVAFAFAERRLLHDGPGPGQRP